MAAERNARILGTIPFLITVCLLALPAQAQYSGGTGTADDPYQIATAEDLIALGEMAEDYDKHFILTADINLDPNLPGRKVFDRAVIAPDANDTNDWFNGTPFTGVFDGNGHTISHLTIDGHDYLGLFGQLGLGAEVRDLGVVDVNIASSGNDIGALVGNKDGTLTDCYSSGSVGGNDRVGGLVGCNDSGRITASYSNGSVSGNNSVGGLVGMNNYQSSISSSYSSGSVSGTGDCIGGLVGINSGAYDMYEPGNITASYSSGSVSGTGDRVGGLVGCNRCGMSLVCGRITTSFWDIQTSGRTQSAGGTGKTTVEMQTAKTFLDAGWDFMGETENGTGDTWGIIGGKDYPRFVWEHWAFLPNPRNGATDLPQTAVLNWCAPIAGAEQDVYLGEDETAIATATTASESIYRGRQPRDVTTYDPGVLECHATYYWRIDEVNDANPNSPWKGNVWRFSTTDFLVVTVVDDFESYTDDMKAGEAIFQTWHDAWGYTSDPNDPNDQPSFPGNGTNAAVGNWESPFAEQGITHGGVQSMPMDYDNGKEPWYSEADRTWDTPQDWMAGGADTLTLYRRGEPNNSPEPLYVGIEDSAGRIAVVVHPDADAVLATEWQKWHIALSEVRAAGVDVAAVKKMVIGVGDRKNPKPGGTGRMYIDDIRLTKRMP